MLSLIIDGSKAILNGLDGARIARIEIIGKKGYPLFEFLDLFFILFVFKLH
jgi:hypothetical protein